MLIHSLYSDSLSTANSTWKNTSSTPPTGLRGPTGIFFAVPQTSTPPSSLLLLSVTKSNKAGPLVPPHPLVFATYEYCAFPSLSTLEKWKDVDLGPPLYVVSEDTSPNVTVNPAFELAYWRFGLVKNNLAPLPIQNNGTSTVYTVYEGIERDFWMDPAYINDHPSLVGLHGWLPPTEGLD
ncbi:hypothetical protein F5051DRAFT_441611 [Lentinula edodes]|nr:hypothetical protein F5051DRAFT_441611 [Lentinula edodes]